MLLWPVVNLLALAELRLDASLAEHFCLPSSPLYNICDTTTAQSLDDSPFSFLHFLLARSSPRFLSPTSLNQYRLAYCLP